MVIIINYVLHYTNVGYVYKKFRKLKNTFDNNHLKSYLSTIFEYNLLGKTKFFKK